LIGLFQRGRGPLLALAASTLVIANLVASPFPASAGTPQLTLAETAPATVLYGTPATVTLTAANPSPALTGTPVYNTSFMDVLPVGVGYVAGSSTLTGSGATTALGDPTIFANQPGVGETTLVWANVGDIQPSSSQRLSFQVQGQTDLNTNPNYGPNPILPGDSYTDSSSVYANTDPRYAPQFTLSGPPTPSVLVTDYTDYDTAGGTTQVVPLRVATSEPSPEHELPRGVHDNQVAYTVTVTNNAVRATDTVSVTDYIPAGLEFLGCGGVDNTTAAGTSSAVGALEYPGAPTLVPGAPAITAPQGCPTPTSVDTVAGPVTTSAGTVLPGPLTEVTWALPDLSASQSYSFNFVAAVPLQENTTTWTGTTPSAASLLQAANLDNNSGPQTHDGQLLTTTADASGTYTGATGPIGSPLPNPISAEGAVTVEAIDLAVQKTESTSTFVSGQIVDYTLHYQTSEYRYTTTPVPPIPPAPPGTPANAGAVLTDHVDGGLCPTDAGALVSNPDSDFPTDCALATQPPSVPYTGVSENSDGSFDIVWNLGTLAPNTKSSLTYHVLDRAYYQAPVGVGIGPSTPTLIGDSLGNSTNIQGTVNGTCYEGTPGASTPDPTCSGATPHVISSGESTPMQSSNGSHATQTAPVPQIVKTISEAVAPGGTLNCSTATYVTPNPPAIPYPAYEAGDTICFHLEVDFPAGVYTHDPVVTDFLPPNTTYTPASAAAAAGNTATIVGGAPVVGGTSPDSLTFTLGDVLGTNPGRYVSPGQTFAATFALTASAPPTEGNNYTFTQNLMKLAALNTAGQSVSLRSQVGYELTQPVVEGLTKTVALINGVAPAPGQTVEQGDLVTYDVNLHNSGLVEATNTTVWDNLPSQLANTDCPLVTSISDGGTCVPGTPLQIHWSGITLPAGTVAGGPGLKTLTYVVTIPSTVAAGETLTNHAGVRNYTAQMPNNGGTTTPTTYYPINNIDPSVPTASWNAPPADDTAAVSTARPTVSKAVAPTINGPGSATIGEPIKYTLTTTIPSGTTLYGATIDDPLGADLAYSSTPAPATATYQGGGALVGFTLSTTSSDVNLAFPATFQTTATPAPPVVIVITFYATVVGGHAGDTITNQGTLDWNTSSGAPLTAPSNQTSTTIVEPHLSLVKTDAPGGTYHPGDTVTYTVTVSNTASNVSAAHDVVVTDTLPVGLTGPACGTTPAPWVCALSGTGTIPDPYVITWTLPTSDALGTGAPNAVSFTFTANLPSPAIGTDSYVNSVAATATSLDTTAYPDARTTYTASATDTVNLAGPTIAKAASPTSVTNGVDTTYTVTIHVPANLQFPNFTAIDTLPDGMTFDSYGAPASYTCTDTVGSCGADVTIHSIGTPAADGSGKTALAWWIGNLVDDPGIRTITVNYTAYPSKTYHGGSTVASPVTLNNAVGTYWDRLDGTLPVAIPLPGSFQFNSGTVNAPLSVVAPNLTIVKAVSTGSPTPGVPFTYTVTVRNTGSSTAYDPTVTDTIPSSLNRASPHTNIVSTTQGVSSYAPGTGQVTWDMTGTTLAPGATATLVIQTELGPSTGLTASQVITNTATIDQYYGVPAATATGDPSRYFTYGPVRGSADVTPVFPVLAIAKSTPGGTTATVGNPFSWQLAITDTAAASATSVGVTDTLPPYWTYTPGTNAASITQASGPPLITGAAADPVVSGPDVNHQETLTWSGGQLGDLGASSSNQITIAYTATPQDGVSRSNTNTAFATANDAAGYPGYGSPLVPYQSPNASAVATIPTADLQVVKTIGTGGLVAGGASNSYDLQVTNNGPDPATAPIVVADTAPAGTTFTGSSSAGWNCTLGGGGASISCQLTAGAGTLAGSGAGAIAPPLAIGLHIPSSYLTTYPTGDITNTGTVSSPTHDPNTANNSSTVDGTVTAKADLEIVKSHTDPFTAGETGTYQLVVSNLGPSDSPGPVTVTDTIPAGETYVSATSTDPWVCTYPAPAPAPADTLSCTLAGGLINGASSSIQLTVAIPANQPPTVAPIAPIVNTARVAGPLPDPNTANNSSSDPTTIEASADLSIQKSHAVGDSFLAGTDVHYTLAVHNAGPSDAQTPVVTDTLPSYLSYVPAGSGGTGWTCGAVLQVVTCTAVSNLAAGADAQPITLVAHIASGHLGAVVNTAHVASSTPDPDTANNVSTDNSTTIPTSADLSIVKSHTGDFTAGTTGTYSFTVHNAGPSDAQTPVVTDTLPAGMSYAGSAGTNWSCNAAGQVVTCSLAGNIVAGTTNSDLTITANIDSMVPPGILTNVASVSSITPDPDLSNNSSTDPTTILAPLLSLTKGVASIQDVGGNGITGVGAVITYSLVATNVGTAPATDVVISDPMLGSLSCAPSQPATLAPSATLACSGRYTVTAADVAAGVVRNTGTVSGKDGTGLPIPGASASAAVPTGSVPTASKSNTPTSAAIGDNSTYTVDVTISPNTQLFNLSAIDHLPDGLTFGSLVGSTCTNQDATRCSVTASLIAPSVQPDGSTYVNFYLGDVVPGSTQARNVAITYTARAAKTLEDGSPVTPGTILTNSVAVYWNAAQKPTPTSSQPSGFDASTSPATAALTVTAPSLAITKTVSNATPSPGETFTYTVTVANGSGPLVSPAYDLTVTDQIPIGLSAPTNISDAGTFAAGPPGEGTITWHVPGPLAAGDHVTFTYSDTLGPSGGLTTGQGLVNTAAVTQYFGSANGQGGDPSRYPTYTPVPPDLTATATVTPQFPILTIAKTTASGAPSGTAELGRPFGWVVTVSNPAGPTANAAGVTDTLPPGWTYDAGSTAITLPGGSNSQADPTIVTASTGDILTWSNLGSVSAGQSIAIAFTATPTTSAVLGSTNANTNSASTTWSDASGATGTASGPYGAGPATAVAYVDAADMAITKTHTGSFPVGSHGTYTLTATNNGPNPAAGVVVVDVVPRGLTPTSVTPANAANWTCTIAGQTVTCTYVPAAFAVGAVEKVAVTVLVGQAAYPSVTNVATVTSSTPDQNPPNNSASDPTRVTQPKLTFTKKVTSIVDVNHDGYTDAGDQINYQLVATNVGDAPAYKVVIEDPLLPAMHCTPGQPATLLPGHRLVCTGSYTITTADEKAGKVVNTAVSRGTGAGGKPVVSPPASTQTPVRTASGGTGTGSGGGGQPGGGGLAFTGGPTLATIEAILGVLLTGMALLVVSRRRRPAHARRRR
jgi:fimbrial isopeptide formation D2 family protein/uncharacterized repeat protein (TIGR01451 family)